MKWLFFFVALSIMLAVTASAAPPPPWPYESVYVVVARLRAEVGDLEVQLSNKRWALQAEVAGEGPSGHRGFGSMARRMSEDIHELEFMLDIVRMHLDFARAHPNY